MLQGIPVGQVLVKLAYYLISLLLKKCPWKFAKKVHKNSPKVSTRIHLFCPQKFTFYVYNKFAEFYFFRGSCLPRKENVCTKKMLLQKGFEPILLLLKQFRFACKKSRESLIKRAERPILLVMPHIGKNSTQTSAVLFLFCSPCPC